MISAAARAMRRGVPQVTVAPACRHPRVFPIYQKYLCFRCLDCTKELEVRDERSLKALRGPFMLAAQLLARGVVLGGENAISKSNR